MEGSARLTAALLEVGNLREKLESANVVIKTQKGQVRWWSTAPDVNVVIAVIIALGCGEALSVEHALWCRMIGMR